MRIWILIGIFLGVLLIAFGVFVFRITEGPPPVAATDTQAGAAITDIHFLDSYKKGVHSIKGTALVPTACTTLSATVSASEATTASSSPVIRIDLNAPVDDGPCLLLPTASPFTLSINAVASAPIEVYTNGTLATSTE